VFRRLFHGGLAAKAFEKAVIEPVNTRWWMDHSVQLAKSSAVPIQPLERSQHWLIH
jgi:hypothetical protein